MSSLQFPGISGTGSFDAPTGSIFAFPMNFANVSGQQVLLVSMAGALFARLFLGWSFLSCVGIGVVGSVVLSRFVFVKSGCAFGLLGRSVDGLALFDISLVVFSMLRIVVLLGVVFIAFARAIPCVRLDNGAEGG